RARGELKSARRRQRFRSDLTRERSGIKSMLCRGSARENRPPSARIGTRCGIADPFLHISTRAGATPPDVRRRGGELPLLIEITTTPEPIGSEHAVRTLRIQAIPRAVFGLPKQFAVRATANQNLQESRPTTSPATMRCLRRGEPQRNNLDAE